MHKVFYFLLQEKKCDCDSYSRTSVCFLVFGMALLVYTSYHRTMDTVSVEEHLSTFFPCRPSLVAQLVKSPGWMHETSAWAWCTGKTQRERVEREVGGGIRMGNTCKSMADSCQCMTKPLSYCKVISLQLIKINEKKKKGSTCDAGNLVSIPGLGKSPGEGNGCPL